MVKGWTAAVALGLITLMMPAARADEVADFYKGKTVQLLVGYGPGGGYDIYARVLARHIGKYLPGNPNVVIQNMPGAGSLRAANYLYAVAPKDGIEVALSRSSEDRRLSVAHHRTFLTGLWPARCRI